MTGRSPGPLFHVLRAGAEALWALALAGFLLHVTVQEPFPFAAGVAAFCAAAVLARALQGRGHRRATVMSAHGAGLLACLAWGLHRGGPDGGWVPANGGWQAWGWWIQSAFWLGLLWVKGASFSRNAGTHERICVQFDKGVAAFGLILLSGLVGQVKWGYAAVWWASPTLFLLFFVLSVAAMGTAPPSEPPAGVTDRGPGTALALAFPLLIWALGAGTVGLFMPFLRVGAEAGLDALETTTSPLGPVLVRVLRFVFAPRRAPQGREGAFEAGGVDPAAGAADLEVTLLERVLGWGLAGVLGTVLVAVAAAVLVFAVKALLARTRRERGVSGPREPLLDRLGRWLERVRRLSPSALLRLLRDPDPVRLFARLTAWGARSGLPRRPTETPLEYGARLSARFRRLSADILLIVELVNLDLYAASGPGADRRREGLLAWRRLRRPANWCLRIRSLLSPQEPLPVP